MKFSKILMVLAILGILAFPAHARKMVPPRVVLDSSGTEISAYSIGAGVNVTTTAIDTEQAAGFNTIIVDSFFQTSKYFFFLFGLPHKILRIDFLPSHCGT